jgi:hypothetical protein
LNVKALGERKQSGQALAEMAAGMAAVLALTAGILQLAALGRARVVAAVESRAAAGAQSMAGSYVERRPGPAYLRTWDPGDDEVSHSADDRRIGGSADAFRQDVMDPMRIVALADRVDPGQLGEAAGPGSMMSAFRFVHGAGREGPVVLLPVVRRLLYREETILIESETWMTWTGGLQ